MTQETNTQKSRFSWSFFLALPLLAGLLIVNFPRISRAVSDNLAALTFLREWGRESRDISQVICERSSQPLALAAQQDQSAAINAAREAYFLGNCEPALANWTLAADNDPQQETAALMRYLSSGMDPELLPANMSAEETAGFLQGLGSWAEINKYETEAAYWFTNAFNVQPSRSGADRLIRLQQDESQQKAVWQQLADVLPQDDPDHWWALGKQADLNGSWQQAVDAYKMGASIAPQPYDFLMAQGAGNLKLDQLDEAQAVFERAAELEPDFSQPYLQLGNVSRQRGDHEKAKTWYEQAVKLAPDKFTPNYWLGLTYYELGEFEPADQYLTGAVQINPRNSSALFYLAQTLYEQGQPNKALARLEEAVRLDKEKHWNWLVTLGDWRAAAEDADGALKAYYQALSLQPDNPKIAGKIENIENP